MIIEKDAHLTLASEGRYTLQVPTLVIFSTPSPMHVNPDHFTHVKIIGVTRNGTKQRIAVGREEGFLYLSGLGFQYYYNDLKNAFSTIRGGTWQGFVQEAQKTIQGIKLHSSGELMKLQAIASVNPTKYNLNKVTELQNELVKF